MSRLTKTEKQLCAMFADGLIERHGVPPSCWHKQRKPKPLSLAIAIRKAKTKGMDLTVAPDGSMTFKNVDVHNAPTLNSEEGTVTPLEQWRAKRRGQG